MDFLNESWDRPSYSRWRRCSCAQHGLLRRLTAYSSIPRCRRPIPRPARHASRRSRRYAGLAPAASRKYRPDPGGMAQV